MNAHASDMSGLGNIMLIAFFACLILPVILFINTKKYISIGSNKYLAFSFLSVLPLGYSIALLIMLFSETAQENINFYFLISLFVGLYMLSLYFSKKLFIYEKTK